MHLAVIKGMPTSRSLLLIVAATVTGFAPAPLASRRARHPLRIRAYDDDASIRITADDDASVRRRPHDVCMTAYDDASFDRLGAVPSPERRATKRRVNARSVSLTRSKQAMRSLTFVVLPAIASAVFGFLYYDDISFIGAFFLDDQTRVLIADDNNSGQFVQNFLIVVDLLFAILAGSSYSELYEQQESIYLALYTEVSVARSLLEQLTLVGQARPWYGPSLRAMQSYISDDLCRLDVSPVELLSERPVDDPLESIFYMTSIGVPSVLYDTLRELRQARGVRLGALQRKFPALGVLLLYVLGATELLSFPLLGAGIADQSPDTYLPSVSILDLQSTVFATLLGMIVLVLRIIEELWQSNGGVFNVDDTLQQMIFGLEEELDERIRGQLTMRGRPPPDRDSR